MQLRFFYAPIRTVLFAFFLWAIGTPSSQGQEIELTLLGKILVKDKTTAEDEVSAAKFLADYFHINNNKIPKITSSDAMWLETELSSGELNRIIYALGTPEGCFGLYRKISTEIADILEVIAAYDPTTLSALSDKAPEDLQWIRIQAKLANPLTIDVLNCPSKYLDNVSPFNPISNVHSATGQEVIVLYLISSISEKFILGDSRFVAQQD